MAVSLETSYVGMFHRIIRPEFGDLPDRAARALLGITFEESDHKRMAVLAEKANNGGLTEDERDELENYLIVDHVLSLLHLRASRSLRPKVAKPAKKR